MAQQKLYPIGVQDFKGLIEDGYLYVDKTDLVYKLVHSGKNAFLGRPRRFGKSLLCTTLKYYFLGDRELFRGFRIERLETEWVKRPVLHLCLSTGDFTSVDGLKSTLSRALALWEKEYGSDEAEETLADRFAGIMRRAHEQSGEKVAVLVDEYDKPLLEAMDDTSLQDEFRKMLKAFYGTIKGSDGDIHFVFLTGVTKFSKVSVFSDLNNIDDISLWDEYAAICGITKHEVDSQFGDAVAAMAESYGLCVDAMRDRLRETYDGYYFSPCMTDIYNPFSLLSAFKKKTISHFWFATGTPTFLVKLLRRTDYDLKALSGVEVTESRLGDVSEPEQDPVPLLFQSGYLTIKKCNREFGTYILDFPNREVREGFFNLLLPQYCSIRHTHGNMFNIAKFVTAVREGRIDDFLALMKSLMSDIPYTQARGAKRQRLMEQQYQNIVYIVFTLMGFYTEVEHHTALGRADLVLKTSDYIYVMEFKVGNGTAEEALRQIDDNHYADPYMADSRKLIKVGVGFDSKTRTISNWVTA